MTVKESWFDTDRSGEGKQEGNESYNAFVDKFKIKRTTDDCYTPDAVYDVICRYVEKEFDAKREDFVRPFYPGEDYEKFDYPRDCVVVDNPPFSILSKIIRFYVGQKIRFFLFVPHLTAGHCLKQCQLVLTNASIIYANGAKVKTSFATNLFDSIALRLDGKLKDEIEKACGSNDKKHLSFYDYPPNLWKSSTVGKYIDKVTRFDVPKSEIVYTKSCGGLKLFGGGFFVSDRVVAAEMKVAAEEKKSKRIRIELTAEEKKIVEKLNAQ